MPAEITDYLTQQMPPQKDPEYIAGSYFPIVSEFVSQVSSAVDKQQAVDDWCNNASQTINGTLREETLEMVKSLEKFRDVPQVVVYIGFIVGFSAPTMFYEVLAQACSDAGIEGDSELIRKAYVYGMTVRSWVNAYQK